MNYSAMLFQIFTLDILEKIIFDVHFFHSLIHELALLPTCIGVYVNENPGRFIRIAFLKCYNLGFVILPIFAWNCLFRLLCSCKDAALVILGKIFRLMVIQLLDYWQVRNSLQLSPKAIFVHLLNDNFMPLLHSTNYCNSESV